MICLSKKGNMEFSKIAMRIFCFVFPAAAFLSCTPSADTLFKLIPSEQTGIVFNNTITETDSFNILTEEYIYNGGGVAIADFNNDGLQDIFFSGNEVPNKLYLNKGKFQFQDITSQANVNVPGRWNSGVVVVDINNDGWKDLYVCATMNLDSSRRANMLFLNKGIGSDKVPTFREVASEWGLADTGHSTMAAFFDYDLDGDLDLYVLTNQRLKDSPANYRVKIVDGSSPNNDRLYRNNGNETFSNVTREAGILYEGFGLGLSITDFNLDGWPDIYVCNDFISNDLLYVNNKNGTFTNEIAGSIGHQSHSSMGTDASDFNNDGLPDIITLDMLPETNSRKKTTINNKNYISYINNEHYNYEYQYVRNMLHHNLASGGELAFSEIGMLSGVHQTEWSWSPLFADFDNDGLKDLVITNGFPKDITDKDFSNYREDVGAYVSIRQLVDSIPVIKIPNYAFRNNGDLTFEDASREWGFTQPSFSNGAAFTDLDNDGDLDYVVNNINDEAFLYENTLISEGKNDTLHHYLRIKLNGPALNKQSIGTKVTFFYDGGKKQYVEHQVARGYLSSVDDIIHVGLGRATTVDSIKIIWPDGRLHSLQNIRADQMLEVVYNASLRKTLPEPKTSNLTFFKEVSSELNLLFKHNEVDKIDYNIQRTLPHKFSQSGPGICVGDVNNDSLDDLVVGGSVDFSASLYVQKPDGTFIMSDIQKAAIEKKEEDEGLLLFDADGDADLDLYIVSGSIEHQPPSKYYQDRLYKNDGKGKFILDPQGLPTINASGSCVRAADFDGDNDLDLFVGGRVLPGSYPFPETSYLLQNNNGKFEDVTSVICPDLAKLGMITDALFTDFNNDGKTDLIVTGEFMPVTFFRYEDGRFNKLSDTGIQNYSGWWNSLAGGDFDRDGDTDYIAGNLGLNNGYQVTKEHPLKIYAKDLDKNGSIDAVLACYIKESLDNNTNKKLYPVHFWDELNGQSPRFRQQFSTFEAYGRTTIDNLFTKEDLNDALVLAANHFETSYIENIGDDKFKITALPALAQVAPVNGIVVDDINDDGNPDILMIGNDYGNEVFFGRYDAFRGLALLGNGMGEFRISQSTESGFVVKGDAKGLAKLFRANDDEIYIATQNQDSLKVFAKNSQTQQRAKIISLQPLDSWAEMFYADGRKLRVEFYYGCGYLSQSSRKMKLPPGVHEVVIYHFDGQSRKINTTLP
jgi:hypothetical protein